MRIRYLVGFVSLALLLASGAAHAATLCTIIADVETGAIVREEGDCDTRTTPASTFKLPLAIMGYDAGALTDAHAPRLPYKQGYPDWVSAWKQPHDPASWMKHSVLWYSQRIAEAIGRDRFDDYLRRFDFGNRDGSGDPGKNNALERSWVSSSLKISPREQTVFLSRLVRRDLPVSRQAMDDAVALVETAGVDGWTVFGKTGSAFPRRADGSFDYARGWGWYVGWAERGNRKLVFARLTQDEKRVKGPAGLRTRDQFLKDLPALLR